MSKVPGPPGTFCEFVSYDDGYGTAVVLAHSRTPVAFTMAPSLADDLLREALSQTIGGTAADGDLDYWRPALDEAATFVWHSVTKEEVERGSHECDNDMGCRPGEWCTGGTGAAWVRLYGISHSVLYALDDERPEEDQ